MKYCPDCKHFISCDPYKMLLYMAVAEDCKEFEKDTKGGGENAGNEIRDEH